MEHIKLTSCPICNQEQLSLFMDLKDHMITQESFSIEVCNSCGFHFTNPRPAESQIGAYYKSEDYVSHSSSNKGIINRLYKLVRNYTLKRKVKLVSGLVKEKNILDVGSGTGHFLNACKQNGFNVQGLEPDSDAVRFAQTNFGLSLQALDAIADIPTESKDIVTMWHVLEHVYHLQRDFSEFVRVLKPGAVFLIAVPNLESYDAQVYQNMWAAYDVPRHLYHFRQKDIANLAAQYNMKLDAVYPMKFDSFYVSMLSEKYKKGSIFKAFWVGLLSNLKSSKGGYSSQIYILKKLSN